MLRARKKLHTSGNATAIAAQKNKVSTVRLYPVEEVNQALAQLIDL
jgi:hypothetical protein